MGGASGRSRDNKKKTEKRGRRERHKAGIESWKASREFCISRQKTCILDMGRHQETDESEEVRYNTQYLGKEIKPLESQKGRIKDKYGIYERKDEVKWTRDCVPNFLCSGSEVIRASRRK